MGPWTYYAPLWLGTIVAGIVRYGTLDQYAGQPTWLVWSAFVAGSLAVGVVCQIVMIGGQGLFAQVLPVPGGRSIRGRPAVGGGVLLIGWAACGVVAVLLRRNGLPTAALVLAIISLAALAGTIAIYVWSWPAALRDFPPDRGIPGRPTE